MIFNYPVLEKETILEFLNDFYLSKSKIYTLFLEKNIKINQKECNKDSILFPGDIVSIIEKEEIDFKGDSKKLNIIYEDDYLLIINKPAQLIVHPDSKDKTGSLCNIVAQYYKNKGYDLSIKYAHRLDIETTGIILFCKDMLSMSYMNHMIALHQVKRYYRCFVEGKLKEKTGSISLPIGEDRHHKSRRRVSKTGQNAITHYEVIEEFKDYTLLEVNLETGRTHQIRVHFSHLGHPLLGDTLYYGNKNRINRVALHSYRIAFVHPVTKEEIQLTKDLPYDMKCLLKRR